jgi:glutathione synthase/RimK-type ligase-like ATP-grasp enzyme
MLWAYDDSHYWGSTLVAAARKRGIDAQLFDSVRQPTFGHVFVHMHNHPSLRMHTKRMIQHFATNPQLQTVPSYRESVLFDDKLEQLRQFAKVIPPTHVFRTPTMAREFIDTEPVLPVISKSSEGGGVRTLRTYDDMRREIKQAFSDLGIKNKYGSRQHGVLYWQSYVGDPEYVTRVAKIGRNAIMVKRGRRVNMVREMIPVVEMNADDLRVLAFAESFFETQGLTFGAVDLIPNGESFYLLKFTVSWPLRTFAGSRFKDGRAGTEIIEVMLDEVLS